MANQEQLDILRQGVEVWNQWREEHREVQLNLGKATLSGAVLSGANLNSVNLFLANLGGANLSMANLSGANLSNTLQLHFFGSNLPS